MNHFLPEGRGAGPLLVNLAGLQGIEHAAPSLDARLRDKVVFAANAQKGHLRLGGDIAPCHLSPPDLPVLEHAAAPELPATPGPLPALECSETSPTLLRARSLKVGFLEASRLRFERAIVTVPKRLRSIFHPHFRLRLPHEATRLSLGQEGRARGANEADGPEQRPCERGLCPKAAPQQALHHESASKVVAHQMNLCLSQALAKEAEDVPQVPHALRHAVAADG
mmetsp:Transcript_70879/g.151792  ORF Transcript_70879/g.151792 Transcript_70879/m.151792 type:complete len:224 (-) Transcript_70879:456-1127(-)